MLIKYRFFLLLLLIPLKILVANDYIDISYDALSKQVVSFYPNFSDNPLFTKEMRKLMAPHLIPLNHPLKATLDRIFIGSRVTANESSLAAAGFITLFSQQTTHILVVMHPDVPGYLFKIYLDTETRLKEGREGWRWLTDRCMGAARARNFILKKKMKYFCVPDKWLYPLPAEPASQGPIKQTVVLIVTDMNLVSKEEVSYAWKNLITRKHLDELYYLLSHGIGSRFLTGNIPYTKNGKFALIDTEYPKRKISLQKILPYLSDDMQVYWNKKCFQR